MSEDKSSALYDDIVTVNSVDPALYDMYPVKRGLRNNDGSGVIAGITNISNVHGYMMNEGDKVPVEGKLTFRGYDIYDLLSDTSPSKRYGFEEVAYLLMLGKLPTQDELDQFVAAIDAERELPDGFTAARIMRHPAADLMIMLSRSIISLYADDPNAEDRSIEHEIKTAISLISRLQRIMVLSYHAKQAYFHGDSMIMHRFVPGQSSSETILSMLRPDRAFTPEEARMLDIMMCLHAEHGGGNNSTFTCRVLSSADTDPYSAYAGAVGSLKGSKHGGANHQVLGMQAEIKENVKNWEDDDEVAAYIAKIVNKEAYDKTGLIYGMGHAVYTLSDPRAELLHKYAERLVVGTEHEAEFRLLEIIERLAPQLLAEAGKSKDICANVDLYSGCVYSTLGIPRELLTPMFASARMAGWSAHRFEEIVSGKRIMRPAFKKTGHAREYVDIAERK